MRIPEGHSRRLFTYLGLLLAGSACFIVGAAIAANAAEKGMLQSIRNYDFMTLWGGAEDEDAADWGMQDAGKGALQKEFKYAFVVVPNEPESAPHVYTGNDFNVFGHLGIQRRYLTMQPRVWHYTTNIAAANLILVSSIHFPRETPYFNWDELSKPKPKDGAVMPGAVGFPRVISHFPPKRAYLADRVLRAIGVSWMQMFELRSKVRARCFLGLKMDVAKCLGHYARRHPEINIDMFYPKSFIFTDDPKAFNVTATQFLAYHANLLLKMQPTIPLSDVSMESVSGKSLPPLLNTNATAGEDELDQPASEDDVGMVNYGGSGDVEEDAERTEAQEDPEPRAAAGIAGTRRLLEVSRNAEAPKEVSGVGLTMPRWLVKLGTRGFGGEGIRVFSDTAALISVVKQGVKEGPLVVQRLIDDVMTFRGRRFDLRVYILVTSLSPLTLYINVQGTVVRLAAGDAKPPAAVNAGGQGGSATDGADDASEQSEYDGNAADAVSPGAQQSAGSNGELDRRKFLTNFSVHHDASALVTLDELLAYFRSIKLLGVWKDRTLPSIKRIARRVFSLWNTHEHRKYSYKLWGIDIMLDSDMNPWYIEANPKPMMFGLTKANFKNQHRIMVADMFKVVFWRHYGQAMQPSGTWEIIPADV